MSNLEAINRKSRKGAEMMTKQVPSPTTRYHRTKVPGDLAPRDLLLHTQQLPRQHERPTDIEIMLRPQWDVCVVRRHVLKSCTPNLSFMRLASSKHREPYILPRLVIDLDANDSQFVREAKEEDYAVQDKPPRWRQRDETPLRDYALEKGLSGRVSSAINTHHITAPDLLLYALFGSPDSSSMSRNRSLGTQLLQKQFRDYKIYPLDKANTKIKRLTNAFTTYASKVLEDAGFLPERQPQIIEQLLHCRPSELWRMLRTIASTTEGCTFLAVHGEHVVTAILAHAKSRTSVRLGTGQVLRLLNNLHLNMQSKGVAIGSHLCSAALYYASRRYSLSSVRKYLDILCAESYSPTPLAFKAMERLVVAHRQGPNFHRSQYQQVSEDERHCEILKLLTGWESGGVPQHGEKRQSCFEPHTMTPTFASPMSTLSDTASSVAASSETNRYGAYIVALGYIGASNAVWHEWCNPSHDLLGDPDILLQHRHPDIAQSFALAFLMAKDYNRALHVLQPLFKDGQYDPWTQPATRVPGAAPEDSSSAANEHELPSPTRSPLNTPRPVLRPTIQLTWATFDHLKRYYISNKLIPTGRLLNRLGTSYFPRFFPDKPETILQAMDDYLVPEWLDLKQSTLAPSRDLFTDNEIDWVEKDGVEGLAIRQTGDGKILYFKASSRGPTRDTMDTSPNSSESSGSFSN